MAYQVLIENLATKFTLGCCQVEKVVQNEGGFSVYTSEVYSCAILPLIFASQATHSQQIPVYYMNRHEETRLDHHVDHSVK